MAGPGVSSRASSSQSGGSRRRRTASRRSARRAPGARRRSSHGGIGAAAARAARAGGRSRAGRAGRRSGGRNTCPTRDRPAAKLSPSGLKPSAVEDRDLLPCVPPPILVRGPFAVTQICSRPVPPARRTTRIAPRWVRSVPKSRSTSPASGSSSWSATSRRAPRSPTTSSPTSTSPGSIRRGRRGRAVPRQRAAALGLDGHDDRRAGGAVPSRRARLRRPRQPDPLPHRLGADRRPGSLTRVRVSHWTEPTDPLDRVWRCSAAAPSGRSAAGARRCGGCATSSSPSIRPERIAVAGGNRYATGIP